MPELRCRVPDLRAVGRTALPILELCTEGLFTGPAMLDDWLRHLWEQPDDQARAESGRQTA